MISVFEKGRFPPAPASFNLAAHVLGRAGALAEKPALVLPGDTTEVWSYGALEQAVRGTATGLLRTGLTPGDIVLMRLGNSVDFPLTYLGAIAAGLIPVPTSAQLTLPECRQIVDTLSPVAIVAAPDVVVPPHPRVIGLEALRAMRDLPAAAYDMGDPERMAYVVFTSGTSGKPRAVAHAHRAIWARQMMMRGWYGLSQSDRLLHAGAFNWTYTLGTGLMDPWTMGATALIPAQGTPPEHLGALIASHDVTIFAAAPGVYRRILKSDNRIAAPHLRHGLTAGEKLAPDLHTAWTAATGTPLFEAYGMSECSTFISSSPDHPARDGRLGTPQEGRRVAIMGADGPVEMGTEGTIAVHRSDPGLMLGYLGQPEETASRFRGPWFMTGDQGVMEDDGQIAYLGRADDMMNAGGYRVSPLEVEGALAGFPGIVQVGATDVAVASGARIIVAFYTAPTPLPEPELAAFAAARLARYKQPRAYVHLDALPAGANGKLLRRALPPFFKGSAP
ncbi:MAG: acyl--CoA ligase [Rhodobacteraceae bacterium]|nr:acyl--CoA ligase [Paracoccaceae bacterium]